MRSLVIVPQPFFSPRGTPFSVYYRTVVTAQLGVQVDLLTYGEGDDVEIPGVRIIRIPNFSWLGNVKTGPSVLKMFLDVFIALWTIGLLIRGRYDFVHAHEEAVFICRFLKPIFRFKLVYDMHSSLPQQLENFNFSNSRVLKAIFKWLEDGSLQKADAVITICPALADYANSLLADPGKHLLIENSIFDEVKLSGNKSGRYELPDQPELELPDAKRLVVYTGTLEHYQGIDILIEAFEAVIKRHADAYLVIVGGAPEQVQEYSRLADRLGLTRHCMFTGRLPQKVAREYNKRGSVLVSSRTAGNNTPLKIYELLASCAPLVATNIYSHTQVLDESVAFLVEPTPEGMAEGITDALSSMDLVNEKVANARALYEEKYSRSVYEAKMRKLLAIVESA